MNELLLALLTAPIACSSFNPQYTHAPRFNCRNTDCNKCPLARYQYSFTNELEATINELIQKEESPQ